jgi:hypothetical protein
MTEATERRFVMEPRLDAEVESINDAIALKANLTDPRLTDERTPLDDSVTSAKIVNGTIVNADVSDTAAIAYTKVTRPPLSNASDVAIDAGTLSGGQVIKYNAGTSNWVNGAAAGGVTASATAPTLATAAAGDAWFDTNDGTLYVCYVDVDSTKQWVQVQANSALEGSILARLGALESQSIAYGSMSPNYIINGGFDIWQRGTSIATGAGASYTADRWQTLRSGAVAGMTTTRQSSGLTGIQYCGRFQRDSGNTSTAALQLWQSLETINSIPLAGSSVTFSFYVRAGANYSATGGELLATLYSGTGTDQNLNLTGFTASTIVGSTTSTLTTSWQRISISGTVGTSVTQLGFLFQANPTGTASTNDYFEVTGVQLERGSVATSFRRNAPSIQGELAACQRYFYRMPAGVKGPGAYYGASAIDFFMASQRPVPMRANGTASITSGFSASNFTVEAGAASRTGTNIAFVTDNPNFVRIQVTTSVATSGHGGWLTGAGTIDVNAEL